MNRTSTLRKLFPDEYIEYKDYAEIKKRLREEINYYGKNTNHDLIKQTCIENDINYNDLINFKTFFMTDIHGCWLGIKQALERSNFRYDRDLLIFGGDVNDGYPQTYECVEELLKIENIIIISSNHTRWLLDFFETGATPYIFTSQGGLATLKSYDYKYNRKHHNLLRKSIPYFLDANNRLFMHGGFDVDKPLEEHTEEELAWDRTLVNYAYNCHHTKSCDIPKKLQKYNEIFVGHTSTELYDKYEPINLCNVWMMDTGAGYDGKVTIMDINTKEYWQSDFSKDLYGPNQGRNFKGYKCWENLDE